MGVYLRHLTRRRPARPSRPEPNNTGNGARTKILGLSDTFDEVSMSSEAELFTPEEERWYAWWMLPGYGVAGHYAALRWSGRWRVAG